MTWNLKHEIWPFYSPGPGGSYQYAFFVCFYIIKSKSVNFLDFKGLIGNILSKKEVVTENLRATWQLTDWLTLRPPQRVLKRFSENKLQTCPLTDSTFPLNRLRLQTILQARFFFVIPSIHTWKDTCVNKGFKEIK